MGFLIVLLFSLALFHWAYEGAIAPSWRLGLRYKLFAVRDDLRNVAERKGIGLSEPAIQFLEESINSVIEHMREVNFGFLWSFRNRVESDKSFCRRVEFRAGIVDAMDQPDFREIRRRYNRIYREVLTANSGAWFLYLVPCVYCVLCWKWLRVVVKKIALLPESEFPALSRGIQDIYAEPA
jgi:hypothetical protein